MVFWDGGATKSVGGVVALDGLVDRTPYPLTVKPMEVNFNFAGGESSQSRAKMWCEMSEDFKPGIHTVRCESTPILLGLDVLRQYGIVLDYYNDTVYSHVLGKYLNTVILSSGHLGLDLTGSVESEE